MFRDVREMSKEEARKELEDMKSLLAMSAEVTVDKLLEEKIDLDLLGKYNLTIASNGQFFDRSQQGIFPSIVEKMYIGRSDNKKKMLEYRKELELETDKDKRFIIEKKIARYNNLQLAKKTCLNSCYGAMGNEFFRFFDIRLASAITKSGQLSIQWVEKDLNNYINSLIGSKEPIDIAIYEDTDSIYIRMKELIEKFIPDTSDTKKIIGIMDKISNEKIQPFIDKSYQKLANYVNAYAQKMHMKREALADKGIFLAKKHYIMNVYNNEGVEYKKPKLKVMGLQMIKSTTPPACKPKFWEALDIIFNKDEDTIIQFIEDFRKEFSNLRPEEIASISGVNGLEKYKGKDKRIYGEKCPIHVRGSLFYNYYLEEKGLTGKYEKIKEGEKIKYIYLKEPNPIHSDTIAFPMVLPKELELHKYIDYDKQYEKSFLKPLKDILEPIGWKTEKVNSLSAFFN